MEKSAIRGEGGGGPTLSGKVLILNKICFCANTVNSVNCVNSEAVWVAELLPFLRVFLSLQLIGYLILNEKQIKTETFHDFLSFVENGKTLQS